MTVAQLRQSAKRYGLRGYSRWNKARLVEELRKASLNKSLAENERNQTVAELREEAKRRGLRGYSKLRKAQLLSLLESTARLAAPVVTLDEQIRQAESDFARLEDAKVLARIMRDNNSGRPASIGDISHWRAIEAKAVQSLRDSTTCERTRRELANRYVSVTSGVQA